MQGLDAAIQALINLGKERTFQRIEEGPAPAILVPQGTSLLSLESYLPAPVRVRERQEFIDPTSFAGYVTRFQKSETILIASVEKRTLSALIDYHGNEGQPSWSDHRADLVSIISPDWQSWSDSNGQTMSQVEFAEFIEDQNHCIVEPDAARMIELALNLQSTTDVTFSSKINISNGLATFSYSESPSSGSQSISFPTKLHISLSPFRDSDPVDMNVRMRYRTNGGNPKIFYQLDRPDRVIEQSLRKEWEKASTQIGLPVLVGP